MPDLLEQLEQTRPGYDEERQWHRFLLDAYSGTGGFTGSVRSTPAGFWGAAAEIYSTAVLPLDEVSRRTDVFTYLDRFPREDIEKFNRRVQGAHYPNYIAPLTDLKMSFMLRKPLLVDGRPPPVEDWREDTDGRGTTWDELKSDIVLRAAVVGWCPVVIDMPPAPRNVDGSPLLLTRAVANELGLRPTAVPLFPGNLVDYQTDDHGSFMWAKVRTDHMEQPDPFAERMFFERYTIWWPDRFEQYEVTKDSRNGKKLVLQTTPPTAHDFGEVPVAILRNKPSPDDPVKGVPMHGQESVEARALFNRQSELDEHMRGQVFAVLVLAAEENEERGEVTIGTDNGLYLDPQANNQHYFLAPPGSVAEAYEKRLDVTVDEIYRQARVEFIRPTTSRQSVSGIARKFEFAQTDRLLADLASQCARFEEHIDQLVGRALGVSEDVLDGITVTPPATFDIEDLATDLEIAVTAIDQLSIGPTAERLLRGRVIEHLLPNLHDEDKAQIDADLVKLEQERANQAQIDQALAASLQAAPDDEGDDDEPASPQPPVPP